MPLFLIFISEISIETSTFSMYSNVDRGLHGGVDVKWSGGLLVKDLLYIDVIVVGLKSAEERNIADTSQLPNGKIWIDKSHLLPINPARQ
jgi:hypothetical protein